MRTKPHRRGLRRCFRTRVLDLTKRRITAAQEEAKWLRDQNASQAKELRAAQRELEQLRELRPFLVYVHDWNANTERIRFAQRYCVTLEFNPETFERGWMLHGPAERTHHARDLSYLARSLGDLAHQQVYEFMAKWLSERHMRDRL